MKRLHSSFLTARNLRIAVLALATVALTAGDAWAQDAGRGGRGGRGGFRGGGPMGQYFQPEFIRRDLTLVDRELDLDESQAAIVEALLFDYDTAFTEAAEAMRDRFSEMRPARGEEWEVQREERRAAFTKMRGIRERAREMRDSLEGEKLDEAMEALRAEMETLREEMRELRPPMPEGAELERLRDAMKILTKQWRAERAAIRGEFMNNLRVVLNDEQGESWVDFERALTREKSLRNGRISGEREDLFLVLKEVGVAEKDLWQLDDVLDAYAGSLDSALKARNEFTETQQTEIFGAMMTGDMEKASRLLEREAALRVAVRTVNEQYVDTIASRIETEMPGPLAETFRRSFRDRAFGRIYRPTSTERSFQVVEGMADLDQEALVSFVSLHESYLTELEQMNRELVDVTRRFEPQQNAQRLQRRMSRMRGERGQRDERPEDPIRTAYDRRNEMGDRYRALIESQLTPEQVALLPAKAERENGRQDDLFFGRRGRGGEDRGDGARRDRGDGARGNRNGRERGAERRGGRGEGDA